MLWPRHRSGLFHNVDARVIPGKKGKCQLMFIFKQKIWPEMTSFDVTGTTLVPPEQVAKVMANHKGGPTTVQTLADIKNVIEGWCATLFLHVKAAGAAWWRRTKSPYASVSGKRMGR